MTRAGGGIAWSSTADATGQWSSSSQAPGKPNQPTAWVAEGVDGAMVVNVDLGALAVELPLGAVARVREPAGIFQARGEHRGNGRPGRGA